MKANPWVTATIGLAVALSGCASTASQPGTAANFPAAASSTADPGQLAQQAQDAQADQDKARILNEGGWQPVPTRDVTPGNGVTYPGGLGDGHDWMGVKCSSQPPDTPPDAAVGGNITITVWNPGPDDEQVLFDQVDFPGGGYSPLSNDINGLADQGPNAIVIAAGTADVFHASYDSLVGSWAPGCYISTAGLS